MQIHIFMILDGNKIYFMITSGDVGFRASLLEARHGLLGTFTVQGVEGSGTVHSSG